MKNTTLFLTVVFSLLFLSQVVAQEKFTNQTVIDLVELGFESDVVAAKIAAAKEVSFDVLVADLKLLKEAGVPPAVLALMIERSTEIGQLGIFFRDDGNNLTALEPEAFSGTKTRSLGAAFSYGIAPVKTVAYISGLKSVNQIAEQEFIFQLGNNSAGTESSNWWFSAATSPNEFALTSLKIKTARKERELTIGKINGFVGSSQQGIDTKKSIPFEFEKIGEGRYRVYFKNALFPGEYGFFYQGNMPNNNLNNKAIFDFSIR